jgi:hypothetical protein
MERSRKSSINKISGGSVEEKSAALSRFVDSFENPIDPDGFTKHEREKTPEEKEIIDGVISQVGEFLQEYGAERLSVTSDHIRILDESRFDDAELAQFKKIFSTAKGLYSPETQDVWIFSSKMKSPLFLSKEVVA